MHVCFEGGEDVEETYQAVNIGYIGVGAERELRGIYYYFFFHFWIVSLVTVNILLL